MSERAPQIPYGDYERNMRYAIRAARASVRGGHRPFGCVIYRDRSGVPVSVSWGTESELDPTRHSEILAIQLACRVVGGLLQGCTLVSTHEPCPMCAGAITHAKLSRVVFGSYRTDLEALFRRKLTPRAVLLDTTHPPEIVGGVLRKECIALFDDELAAVGHRHWASATGYRAERCDCMSPFLVQPTTAADGTRFCGYCKGRLREKEVRNG